MHPINSNYFFSDYLFYFGKNEQSRSKCLLQLKYTQTPGRQPTNNQILNSEHQQIALANSVHQTTGTQTWIKRDRLLSETNSFSLSNTITLDTMTKTMDSFSDGSTITQSGLNAFDVELMTPIIGKFHHIFHSYLG